MTHNRLTIDIDHWPLSLSQVPSVDYGQGLINTLRFRAPLAYDFSGQETAGCCALDDPAADVLRLRVQGEQRWPDGSPLLAADVHRALLRAFRTASRLPGLAALVIAERNGVDLADSCRVIADDTVELAPLACQSLWPALLTMREFAPSRRRPGAAGADGTGPYRLTRASQDRGLVRLIASGWQDLETDSLPGTVDFLVYRDRSQAIEDVRQGHLDISLQTGVAPANLDRLIPGDRVTARPVGIIGHLFFNVRARPELADADLRLDIMRRIQADSPRFFSDSLNRAAYPFTGYSPALCSAPRHISRVGGTARPSARNMSPLSLAYAGYAPNAEVCAMLSRILADETGAEVIPRELSYTDFVRAAREHDYDVLYALNPLPYLHPSAVLAGFHSTQGWAAAAAYRDGEYDALIEEAVCAGSRENAARAWCEAEECFMHCLPVVPVLRLTSVSTTREGLSPVEIDPLGNLSPESISTALSTAAGRETEVP